MLDLVEALRARAPDQVAAFELDALVDELVRLVVLEARIRSAIWQLGVSGRCHTEAHLAVRRRHDRQREEWRASLVRVQETSAGIEDLLYAYAGFVTLPDIRGLFEEDAIEGRLQLLE